MLLHRLRDPYKTHPAKRMTVDGVKLRRRKYKKKKQRTKLRRSHKIGLAVLTVSLVAYFGYYGRWAFYRLAFSLYDLLLAVAEYLLRVAQIDTDFLPIRINAVPDVPYVPFIPLDGSELSGFWGRFFSTLFNGDNFLLYNIDVLILLLRVQQLLLPVLLLWIIGSWAIRKSCEDANDDFGKESKGVKILRAIGAFFTPAVRWVICFWYALPYRVLVPLTVFVLCGTNVMTVAVECLAELLHLSVSADYLHLYLQLYKLLLDVTIMLDTLPLPVWLLIGYWLSKKIRRFFAFERLYKFEEVILEFIKRLPLFVLITGKVGVGKTQTNVNLTLSFQDAHRARMKETMMEIRAEFPEYLWPLLDQQIGVMYLCGDLKGKSATRKLFASLLSEDDDLFYGYFGRRTFSDGVTVVHLRDRIVDYAELQYMYRVQCIISSSYSLRVDATYIDEGKLPDWKTDYFRSPPFDPWHRAERAHILDFDTLRLGKTVGSSAAAGAWEFGILSHSEMGKDYGNMNTNKDLKATDPRANIKNDMLIDRDKILRHSSTAIYVPYTQYIGDEQRPSSLQADVLELTDVLQVMDTTGSRSTYHLFLFERFLRDLLLSIWHGWGAKRAVHRADLDVPTFLLCKLIDRYYPKIREQAQLFGYELLSVRLRDGSELDAEDPPIYQLPVSYKKVRAARYATDCYQEPLAERALRSDWEYDLSPTYVGPVASPDEIKAQHSYFGNKILKIKDKVYYDD